MAWSKISAFRLALLFVLAITGVLVTSCGSESSNTPPGAVVGRAGVYDYSPSAIQIGQVQQFWWCGQGSNPNKSDQTSDVILFETINLASKVRKGPFTVLGETPKGWDSVFTCNPKVIGGAFQDPLGDGVTYSYAMYYVGTASLAGVNNSIGVAFSNDGITWKKYPSPVILSNSPANYGVGQPAVYNSDGKQGIWLFYESDTPTMHHVKATSIDGIHFADEGTLTVRGLDPNNPQPSWGDMAYDAKTGYWYAAYNMGDRNPSTTGGVIERGQYGFELYRIPNSSLLTGTSPWELLMTVDSNLTGNESNFIPGFLRDINGNVNVGSYPSIQMYTSMSNPQPAWNDSPASAGNSAAPQNWDIGSAIWVPNTPTNTLNQYSSGTNHEATTGWIDPTGGFKIKSVLGHLYQRPQENGGNVPLYNCKRNTQDYFGTKDGTCQGQHLQGILGYGYSAQVAGVKLVPLYICYNGSNHYLAQDPKCNGDTSQGLLGYALP